MGREIAWGKNTIVVTFNGLREMRRMNTHKKKIPKNWKPCKRFNEEDVDERKGMKRGNEVTDLKEYTKAKILSRKFADALRRMNRWQ